MKLKASLVYAAALIVAQIIRENRPMPQKGKYRLARLHAKLLPEFNVLNERRDEMIKAYDHFAEIKDKDGAVMAKAEQNSVPEDKMAEFTAAWEEIANQEIEVEVEPIPLSQLDLGDNVDGSITGAELAGLGDLVTD